MSFHFSSTFLFFSAEPPKAPTVHIVKSTATAIVVRWRAAEDGNSPLTKIVLNYKMTYGEWADTEVTSLDLDKLFFDCGQQKCGFFLIQFKGRLA